MAEDGDVSNEKKGMAWFAASGRWSDRAFSAGSSATSGRLTTNGVGTKRINLTSSGTGGVAGCAGTVGSCRVPAEDAGMAEGRVLRLEGASTRISEGFRPLLAKNGLALHWQGEGRFCNEGRVAARAGRGPAPIRQAQGRLCERLGRRRGVRCCVQVWFDTGGWVHPPGSPRTDKGRWLRGRWAGLRRRPYEETAG